MIPIASPEVRAERKAICEKCEFKKGVRCGKCGCFILGKTAIKSNECPVGKW